MNSSALPSSIVLRQLASVLSSSSGFKSAHELIEGKEIMSPERSFFSCVRRCTCEHTMACHWWTWKRLSRQLAPRAQQERYVGFIET